MIEKTGDKIFRKALETFGKQTQLSVVKEELAELIVAISHYERNRIGALDLMTEIADVRIMLRQLVLMFDINDIQLDAAINNKIKRLQGRVDREVSNG